MNEETLYEHLKLSFKLDEHSIKGLPTRLEVSIADFKIIKSSKIIKSWITRKKIKLVERKDIESRYTSFSFEYINIKNLFNLDDINQETINGSLLHHLYMNDGFKCSFFKSYKDKLILDGDFIELPVNLYEALLDLKFVKFIDYLQQSSEKIKA